MTDRSRADFLLLGTMARLAYEDDRPVNTPVEINGVLTDYILVRKETHDDYLYNFVEGAVGFGGQVYFSESANRLVIAFEGTESLSDWTITNAAMAFGNATRQDPVAEDFAKRAIDSFARAATEEREATEIVFVGHSLGGYLAKHALVHTTEYLIAKGRPPAQAVVFNSPGYRDWSDNKPPQEFPVTYIYSESWDLASAAIHALDDRLSDDIYTLMGTAGHKIRPLLDALKTLDPVRTDERRRITFTGHSNSNFWEVFNTALDQRASVLVEWTIEDADKRYKVSQKIVPGGDRRSGTETGVNYIIQTTMWLEGGRMLNPTELQEFGLERLTKGTRWDSDSLDWQERCFLPHTPITLADGTTKPIAAIRPGDMVLSPDKTGTLVPARVTRTFVNDVAHVLDFHGTGVTPGHVFLCGAGRFKGRHVPLIDILRDDGAVVRQDGRRLRNRLTKERACRPVRMQRLIAAYASVFGSKATGLRLASPVARCSKDFAR